MAQQKEIADHIITSVYRLIKEQKLLNSGNIVLVATSGGADSVCLLHVLNELSETLKINLHVAHLNHQLRGAESTADALYVSELAHSLKIPFTLEKADVKAYQESARLSLEEAAREVRYDFLQRTASIVGAACVAVGHTQDDNIETILMHMIRGSGTRGLTGLETSKIIQISSGELKIIRPLLEIKREETQAYCTEQELSPHLDSSNLSLMPLRNRIRHQLIPLMEDFNPQFGSSLLRTARIAADELSLVDNEAKAAAERICRNDGENVIIGREALLSLPTALKRSVLRLVISSILGNLKDIELRNIDDVINILNKGAGKSVNLPRGLVFRNDYTNFVLGRVVAGGNEYPQLDGKYELNVPGITRIPGWQISVKILRRVETIPQGSVFRAYFDCGKTGDTLWVRTMQPGDSFQPLGLPGLKKIARFMIDARISRAQRSFTPIVCNGKQIIWLAGLRIDERVKITNRTKEMLEITFAPLKTS